MATKIGLPLLEVGEVINGRYKVVRPIQGGAMANAYLVEDTTLHKNWFLKEAGSVEALPESLQREVSPSQRKMIETQYAGIVHEANLLRTLNNNRIPRIMDTFTNEGGTRLWYIQDLVEGTSALELLKQQIKSNLGAISSNTVVRWGIALCEVLGYLHSLSTPVIYRDMKPANFMVVNPGQETEHLYLIDFGTAEIMSGEHKVAESALGTSGYAPQAQYRNEELDTRWDLFALGATLFYLSTGINPATEYRKNKKQGITGVDYDTHAWVSGVSEGLRKVILKATNEDLNQGYQNAAEMLADLKHVGVNDVAIRRKGRIKLWVTRGVAIAAVAALVATGIGTYIGSRDYSGQLENAQEIARSSGRMSDWLRVNQLDGKNFEAYYGMLKAMERDGKITKTEEGQFLGALSPNLAGIKNDGGKYANLAYQIGTGYFFYYDDADSNAGQQASLEWLKEAVEGNGGNPTLAKALYNVANFQSNIQSSLVNGTDTGMYGKMWKSLKQSIQEGTHLSDTQQNEVVQASLKKSQMDMISNYSYQLAQDGVTKQDQEAVLQGIIAFADAESSSTRVQQLKREIKSQLDSASNKINVAYSDRNSQN